MASISIDIRMINSSGIGTYLQNLIPLVIDELHEHNFYLLGNNLKLSNYEWTLKKNVKVVNFDSPIYSISEQILLKKKIPENTSLFWSPHYNIPLFYRGKLLVTIHDVLHLALPRIFDGFREKIYSKG